MGGIIRGRSACLTPQREQFARMVAQGHSFAAAYRAIFPPRQGERSKQAELVAAKRLAHHPAVEERIEQLQQQLLASDPEEMRRRALIVLSKIMAKQLDPRYRRTALDVLKYLDERGRVTIRAEGEKYRALLARLAALKAAEGVRRSRAQSSSARSQGKAEVSEPRTLSVADEPADELNHVVTPANAEDAVRRRAKIEQAIAERRRLRQVENFRPRALPPTAPRPAEPPQAAEEDAGVKEDGFQWARKPGRFGKGGWMRVPVA
jgi:hypothetical protein